MTYQGYVAFYDDDDTASSRGAAIFSEPQHPLQSKIFTPSVIFPLYDIYFPPTAAGASDPFFRGLDRSIRAEHIIRERAIEMLQVLEDEPWRIGGPDAQDVEHASACRIIAESFDREGAEIARAVWSIKRHNKYPFCDTLKCPYWRGYCSRDPACNN